MFQLNNLPGIKTKSKKRIGRGGNRGKNAGFGNKGQVKRSGKMPVGFEGGQKPLIRRLPKIKGYNFSGKNKRNLAVLTTARLSKFFDANEEISLAKLVEKELIGTKIKKVRIIKSLGIDFKPKIVKEDEEKVHLTKSLV